MAAVVVVDLAKMMDEDEEVVLELSNWIGENEKKLSLYGVISLPLGDGEGWLVLYIFVIGEVSLAGHGWDMVKTWLGHGQGMAGTWQ